MIVPDAIEKRIYVFAAMIAFVSAIWLITEQVGMAQERAKNQTALICAQEAIWRDVDNNSRGCR